MKNIFGGKDKEEKKNAQEVTEKVNKQASQQAPQETSTEEKPEQNETAEIKAEERPSVPKKITCRRCKGDGVFHSNRTGIRAKTAAKPLADPSKVCPQCKGTKEETILITHKQAQMEIRVSKAKKQADQAAAKARAAAKHAEKVAKEAEEKASEF
jgi:hypothetical protein